MLFLLLYGAVKASGTGKAINCSQGSQMCNEEQERAGYIRASIRRVLKKKKKKREIENLPLNARSITLLKNCNQKPVTRGTRGQPHHQPAAGAPSASPSLRYLHQNVAFLPNVPFPSHCMANVTSKGIFTPKRPQQ